MANGIALLNNDKDISSYMTTCLRINPIILLYHPLLKSFPQFIKKTSMRTFIYQTLNLDSYIQGFLDTIEENIEGVITNVNEEDSGVDFEESAIG